MSRQSYKRAGQSPKVTPKPTPTRLLRRPAQKSPAPDRQAPKAKAMGPTKRSNNKAKAGGINVPKFASEVSRNFSRGVARAGEALDKAIPSRKASGGVTKAMRDAPKARQGLRKALGK